MTIDDLYQQARGARDPIQVALDLVAAAGVAADKDPGAPFEADVLEALALLETVPPAFARAMSVLKTAKVGASSLRKALNVHTKARKDKERERAKTDPTASRSYIMTGKDNVLVCPTNMVIHFIRTKFVKRLCYNSFLSRYELDGENLTETKAIEITASVEEALQPSGRWDRACFDAALAVMRERKIIPTRHPIQEYLEGLAWDGRPRVASWLIDYLGAVHAPADYVKAIGEAWLISAIARVFLPGCKADHVLILQGPQGIMKSSALQILAGDWFSDATLNLENKDAMMALRGVWIVEMPELASLNRSAVDSIKAFITRRVDRYRPPYAVNTMDQPRECVFAGTVNDAEFLRDETGNRRFWPVEVVHVDEVALRADRDQLWAEAVHLFKEGRPWYLESAEMNNEAMKVQAHHTIDDPWLDVVEEFVIGRGSVSAREVLTQGLGVVVDQIKMSDGKRISQIMQKLGFQKAKMVKIKGSCERRYFRT